MCGKECIRVQDYSVKYLADILAIGRARRPEHELIDLKRADIHLTHAKLRSQVPGNRVRLIRCHRACRRNHNPASRLFRRVAVRRVEHRGILVMFPVPVKEAELQLILVQRDRCAIQDLFLFSPLALEDACDKAAFILGLVTFCP